MFRFRVLAVVPLLAASTMSVAAQDAAYSTAPPAARSVQTPAPVVAIARDLGSLGGAGSIASAIDGNIVVGTATTATGEAHAFALDLSATDPSLLDLGTLGGDESRATDVSGHLVVGASELRSGHAQEHYFAYDLDAEHPAMVDLGFGRGGTTYGGEPGPFVDGRLIAGQMAVGPGSDVHAFVYDLDAPGTSPVDLGTLGGPVSFATAIDGQVVVGGAWRTDAEASSPFAYDLGAAQPGILDLDLARVARGDSPARAVSGAIVAGELYDAAGPRAFVYDLAAPEPALRTLGTLGGPTSAATAVDAGVVVGTSSWASGHSAPFAYDLSASPPTLLDLGDLGGDCGDARVVDSKLVAGHSCTAAGAHAFAYDLDAASPSMVDLGTLGGTNSAAVDASGDVVVGRAELPDGSWRATAWTLAATDGPVLQFSDTTFDVEEGSPVATVTVRRLGSTDGVVAADYTTVRGGDEQAVPGEDYTDVSGTVSFPAGVIEQTISVPVIDDDEAEPDEEFAVMLRRPSEGSYLGTPQATAVKIHVSDFQPDALVRTALDRRFFGDDVINATATGQIRRQQARPLQTRVFLVRACNDDVPPSGHSLPVTVYASHPTPGFRVRYARQDVDVTGQLLGADGLTLQVAGRRCAELSVRVRAGGSVKVGSVQRSNITVVGSDDRGPDRVAAVVKVKSSWGPVARIARRQTAATRLSLAVGANGLTAAAWTQGHRVRVAVRPARGRWQAPTNLGDTHAWSAAPQVAIDGRGAVTVLWSRSGSGENDDVVTRTRSPRGLWGPVVTLNRPTHAPFAFVTDERLAVNARGDAVATWRWDRDDHSGVGHTASAYRAAGGRWQEPVVVSRAGWWNHEVTLDRGGNAMLYFLEGYGVGVVRRTVAHGWLNPHVVMKHLDAGNIEVGSNPRGDNVLVTEGEGQIWARSRPAGGRWSAPTWIGNGSGADVQVDRRGRATVGFLNASAGWAPSVVSGSARGVWSLPKVMAVPGESVHDLSVAGNLAGDRLVSWVSHPLDEPGSQLWVRYRPARAATWSAPTQLTGSPSPTLGESEAAVHALGRGVVAWISLGRGESLPTVNVRWMAPH